jgi:hypothetical protein
MESGLTRLSLLKNELNDQINSAMNSIKSLEMAKADRVEVED